MNVQKFWKPALAVLLVGSLLVFAYTQFTKGPLSGMVVVIDSGHGGSDPGSHGEFPSGNSTATIREDEYVYDVSCRLYRLVKALGGTPVMTTWDKKKGCDLDSRPQNEVIPSDKEEYFTHDESQVVATKEGLQKRVDVANATLMRHPFDKVVFIAVHFDATGSKDLQGTHFIAPEGESRALVEFLVDSFRAHKRLRNNSEGEYVPVTYSGDPRTGTSKIYVLSPKTNNIKQRVLVELGNFTNPKDVWRIRDAQIRQEYAQIMTDALVKLNTLPFEQVRQ